MQIQLTYKLFLKTLGFPSLPLLQLSRLLTIFHLKFYYKIKNKIIWGYKIAEDWAAGKVVTNSSVRNRTPRPNPNPNAPNFFRVGHTDQQVLFRCVTCSSAHELRTQTHFMISSAHLLFICLNRYQQCFGTHTIKCKCKFGVSIYRDIIYNRHLKRLGNGICQQSSIFKSSVELYIVNFIFKSMFVILMAVLLSNFMIGEVGKFGKYIKNGGATCDTILQKKSRCQFQCFIAFHMRLFDM